MFLEDPVYLPSAIEDASAIHRSEAERKSVEFHIEVTGESDKHQVLGDRVRLVQVLGNLIGNAVEHTKTGSVIVRWGKASPEELELEIPPQSVLYKFDVIDTG